MSDNTATTEEPRHLTPEEQAFIALSSQFKLVQQSVSELGRSMHTAQQQIAQHFQTATMKELQIFRKVERLIRSNTLTSELMQESLTALNILREDSMKEMTVIMENSLITIKEALTDKTE